MWIACPAVPAAGTPVVHVTLAERAVDTMTISEAASIPLVYASLGSFGPVVVPTRPAAPGGAGFDRIDTLDESVAGADLTRRSPQQWMVSNDPNDLADESIIGGAPRYYLPAARTLVAAN
jgi:hypothetical protein